MMSRNAAPKYSAALLKLLGRCQNRPPTRRPTTTHCKSRPRTMPISLRKSSHWRRTTTSRQPSDVSNSPCGRQRRERREGVGRLALFQDNCACDGMLTSAWLLSFLLQRLPISLCGEEEEGKGEKAEASALACSESAECPANPCPQCPVPHAHTPPWPDPNTRLHHPTPSHTFMACLACAFQYIVHTSSTQKRQASHPTTHAHIPTPSWPAPRPSSSMQHTSRQSAPRSACGRPQTRGSGSRALPAAHLTQTRVGRSGPRPPAFVWKGGREGRLREESSWPRPPALAEKVGGRVKSSWPRPPALAEKVGGRVKSSWPRPPALAEKWAGAEQLAPTACARGIGWWAGEVQLAMTACACGKGGWAGKEQAE
eukprot:132334-Chlamydomonas_euryale.AAC.1